MPPLPISATTPVLLAVSPELSHYAVSFRGTLRHPDPRESPPGGIAAAGWPQSVDHGLGLSITRNQLSVDRVGP